MTAAYRTSSYANDAGGFSGKTSGQTTTLTFGAAVSAGDLLILHIFCANAGSGTTPTFAVSDSVNGSWGSGEVKTITQASGTNNGRHSVWAFPNSAAGTPVLTVTLTGAGGTGMFGGLECAAFSGIATSAAVDNSAAGVGTSSSPTSSSSGATTAANELVVGCYSDFGSGDTINSGNIGGVAAILAGRHTNDGNFWQGLIEYSLDSGAAGNTPAATMTKSTSDNWGALEVIFKLSGGGGGPAVEISHLLLLGCT